VFTVQRELFLTSGCEAKFVVDVSSLKQDFDSVVLKYLSSFSY